MLSNDRSLIVVIAKSMNAKKIMCERSRNYILCNKKFIIGSFLSIRQIPFHFKSKISTFWSIFVYQHHIYMVLIWQTFHNAFKDDIIRR